MRRGRIVVDGRVTRPPRQLLACLSCQHCDASTMSQRASKRYDSKNSFNTRTESMDPELSGRADSIQQRILQLRDSL